MYAVFRYAVDCGELIPETRTQIKPAIEDKAHCEWWAEVLNRQLTDPYTDRLCYCCERVPAPLNNSSTYQ